MKTKKKSKKKNARPGYTPGRNVFGQKAKTELIILKKETAFQQIADCVFRLNENQKQEFAMDCSCFNGNEEELQAIMEKVSALLALKAKLLGVPYSEWFMDAS